MLLNIIQRCYMCQMFYQFTVNGSMDIGSHLNCRVVVWESAHVALCTSPGQLPNSANQSLVN